MKKILIPFVTLSALLLVSCVKEREADRSRMYGRDAISVTVEALAEEEADVAEEPVKTYLGTYQGQDNTVLWGTDEQMQLAITSGGSTVFAASAATSAYNGQASATFSFTIDPVTAASYKYQGFYPASAVVAEDNTNPVAYKVNLPAVQNAVSGKYDPAAYLMIAKPKDFDSKSDSWTASFRRAAALNCLILQGLDDDDPIKRVEIVAPAGVYLCGTREMDLSTGESGEIVSGSRSIDVKYASGLNKSGGNLTVWFTSWGTQIETGQKLIITLYTSDYYYTKNITVPAGHAISFEEGKLNTLRVSFADYDDEGEFLFSGGKGTVDSPYRIEKVADLTSLATRVNGSDATNAANFASAYYLQTADIDFAGGTLQAIGNTNASGAQRFFKGSYDGNGFKVKNVSVANAQNTASSAGSNKAFGFFGYLAEGAHINRLYLDSPKVQATTTYNIGAIAGNIEGSSNVIVENCTVSNGTVSEGGSSGWHVGGLVGQQMSGIIRNCSFSGSVRNTQNNKVGGIVGHMSGGSISGCRVTGATTVIEAANDYAGGIVGLADGTTGTKIIENCVVNCSEITATKGFVGGIVGQWNTGEGIINRCTVIANITNNSASGNYGNLGGIVGYASSSGYKLVIANCCYAGGELCNFNGTSGSVAGILGGGNSSALNQKYIVNCCAFPSKILSGSNTRNLGGIAGWIKNWTIRNCYCPTPHTSFYFNGAQIASTEASSGSIYGWYSSYGIVQDAYWLSTFQVGKGTASPNTNQGLTDTQMKNSGSVTRPSTGESYTNFIAALNADAAAWNEDPVLDVYAQSWELYSNGYPTPKGTSSAISGGGESPSGMSLLNLCNDKINEYGRTAVAANHIYLCSHRGLTYWARQNNYPENCIPSIQKAIELGADMIEIDVRVTQDGVPVVLHDQSVKPVTNCSLSGTSAYVQNMTLATLKSYRMRNRGGSNYPKVNGEYIHVPTLEEVLAVCKDKIFVNIDIGNDDPYGLKTNPTLILQAVENTGMQDQVCIFGASDKKLYVSKSLERFGSVIAIQPWLEAPSEVTNFQPSYFGACKLFQYENSVYYNKSIEEFGKQVHAYGGLSLSNALNEDSNAVADYEGEMTTWYANQSGSCLCLDNFIDSGSDFIQVDFIEIADAYFKKKGLR